MVDHVPPAVESVRLYAADPGPAWQELEDLFLAAVGPARRAEVARQLRLRSGGQGLRAWLRRLHAEGQPPPAEVPDRLIAVYLADPEVLPLHDCADCGLAVPVRPGRHRADDGEPEQVYFPECPQCRGRTGLYAFWSRRWNLPPHGAHPPRGPSFGVPDDS